MIVTDRAELERLEATHDLKAGSAAWAAVDGWGTVVGLTDGTTRRVVGPTVPARPITLRKRMRG